MGLEDAVEMEEVVLAQKFLGNAVVDEDVHTDEAIALISSTYPVVGIGMDDVDRRL